jgi:PAS domain S-box-containing protein
VSVFIALPDKERARLLGSGEMGAGPEHRLGEGEARLAAILEQLPVGVGLIDRNGKFVLRGGLLGRFWDRVIPSLEAEPGKRWKSLQPDGGTLQLSRCPGARALAGETVTPGTDLIFRTDDRQEVYLRMAAAPFRNPAGEIEGAVAILENIDEEKRAEQRLRENEEHLRLALEAGQMGTWEWDSDTNLVTMDAIQRSFFGLPPHQGPLPAEIYWAQMTRAEVDKSRQTALGSMKEGGTFQIEERITRTDGEVVWMLSRGQAKYSNRRCIIGVSFDVTERKRTEKALQESEARLQAAVDLVKLGCYAWDPRTNALQWDETIKAMWGLAAGTAVNYDVWRAGTHPDDLARVEAAIQRCADPESDGLYDAEYRVIGKNDGLERWVATRGQMVFENGTPAWFYGVAIEITQRKHTELTLERRVEARTQELTSVNRQLRAQVEQREIAEATLRQLQRLDAIGQITSGVAHDFNNLLSVILANARLLMRDLREPNDQEGLDLIRAAAERGARLTSQLLAFSHQQRLEPQQVDLNSKIAGMRRLLRVTLTSIIHLNVMPDSNLWPALVDPTQIELIVLNLALNSRDAMPSGGTLTIRTSNVVVAEKSSRPEEPSPGEYVSLAVIDTGDGIPEDVLPKVFEPFFTTKEPGKGSGLGLSQVFGFAKQSGGGVRIESRTGHGTCVTVFLPRATAPTADRATEHLDVLSPLQTERNITVLVVDDDKAVLASILRTLEYLGFAALAAESGATALHLIESQPGIDLVLADFAMPLRSGVELARDIQSKRPGLPVILITGYGEVDALKDFGETRVLRKPYGEEELATKIASALQRHA